MVIAALAALPTLAFVADSSGQPDDRTDAATLRAALERLESLEDAVYAEGALTRARNALLAADRSAQDSLVAERSLRVARAAIVLAERKIDLRRTQVVIIETQRRLTATRARAEAQRRALEALMKERASLARESTP